MARRRARRVRNRVVRRAKKPSAVFAGIRLTEGDVRLLRSLVARGTQGKGKSRHTRFRPFAALGKPGRLKRLKDKSVLAYMTGQKDLVQFIKGGGWKVQALLAAARGHKSLARGLRALYLGSKGKRAAQRLATGSATSPLFKGYRTYRRLSPRGRRSVRSALRHYARRPRFIIKRGSTSGKMGPGVTATYSPRKTCPTTCSFYNDCYANEGNVRANWILASLGLQGLPWGKFLRKLRASPDKKVRVNIAGDLPGDGRVINRRRAFALARAASADGTRTAWTYTHYPTTRTNLGVIAGMRRLGLQVNLSADSLREADAKAATGLDVAVVLPAHTADAVRTPAGRRVLKCPAIMAPLAAAKLSRKPGMGETCSSCGGGKVLCASKDRSYVIGFPAHGQQASRKLDVDAALAAPARTSIFAGRVLPLANPPRRRARWRRK